jgi:hypothetical protein
MPTQFRIASPCSADWDKMPGDDRVRFCPQCKLNVYNFSALAPKEIDRLVQQHEGRLCGRYYQRADGTMLAQNCPVALRAAFLWSSRAAAGVLAALVSVGPAFARPHPQQSSSTLTRIHAAKKSLSMVIVDPSGSAIPKVTVVVRQDSTGKEFTTQTNDAGEAFFSDLPDGTYSLKASFPGFQTFTTSGLKAPYGAQMHFALNVAMMGEIIEIKGSTFQPDPIHRFFSSVKRLF